MYVYIYIYITLELMFWGFFGHEICIYNKYFTIEGTYFDDGCTVERLSSMQQLQNSRCMFISLCMLLFFVVFLFL